MGLINIMHEYVGDAAMPRTCNPGFQVIDYIWVICYAPFNSIKHSDHRGIFIDLKIKNYLARICFILDM